VAPKVVLSTHPWVLGRHRKQFVGGTSFWIDNGLSPQCHRLNHCASSSPTPAKTEPRSPSAGDAGGNLHFLRLEEPKAKG
jgi:hypothetical protein